MEFLPESKHLGGREATVLGPDLKSGRWVVMLKSGLMKSVREEYIVVYGGLKAKDQVGVLASD